MLYRDSSSSCRCFPSAGAVRSEVPSELTVVVISWTGFHSSVAGPALAWNDSRRVCGEAGVVFHCWVDSGSRTQSTDTTRSPVASMLARSRAFPES